MVKIGPDALTGEQKKESDGHNSTVYSPLNSSEIAWNIRVD